MTTSGSYDFNLNATQIITFALRKLGIVGQGEPATGDQIADAMIDLNAMLKQWRADGISLPFYQDIVVFLQENKARYLIGATGDKATPLSDYVKSELLVAGVLGAGTITVDSTTGMASGDVIGIELDDNTIQWTTINGSPSATVITLTATLTGAAAIDNNVYTYTSIAQRPLTVVSARLRSDDGTETDVEVVTRDNYNKLSNKTAQGTISQVYYDPQLTNGVLNIWQTSANVADVLILNAQRQIQDMDSTSNTLDLPQEWLLPVGYNLAFIIGDDYGVDDATMAKIEKKAVTYYESVSGADQESSIQFVPY